MSTSSLHLKGIKFEINCEDLDSFLIAAIKLFLTCDKFIDSIIKAGLKCANSKSHQCTVSSLYKVIEQAKTNKKIDIQPLRQTLADLHKEDDKFNIQSPDWDIVEAISSILNMIHLKAMNYSCIMLNEEALSVNCNESCPFHSNFYFGIDEEYLCKCGNKNITSWDYTNACQFFNISDIFEDYHQEISEGLIMTPKFLIKRDRVEGNSKSFLNKIINNLQTKLINARSENCFLDECPIQNSKISFILTKCPEYYLVNCIWDSINPPYLNVMLATVAISPTLMLNQIYGVGPETRYNLKGIIFQKNTRFDYACRYGDKWSFTGIHEDSGWIELLQEVTVMKYLPVLIVYQKAPIDQPYDFNLKIHKLVYIEKFACECHEYEKLFEKPVFSNNEMSSKLFANQKKSPKTIIKPINPSNFKSDIPAQEFTSEPEYKKPENILSDSKSLKNPEVAYNPSSLTNSSKNLLERVNLDPKILNSVSEVVKTPQKYDFNSENFWKCKCGNFNDNNIEVCGKCFEIKQGVKGWVCKNCKSKNGPEYKIICSTCGNGNKNGPEYKIICSTCGNGNEENFGLINFYDKYNTYDKQNEEIPIHYKQEENFGLINFYDKYNTYDKQNEEIPIQYKQEIIGKDEVKDIRQIDLRGLNEKQDKTNEDKRKELEKNKIIDYRKEQELKRQKELEKYEAEVRENEIMQKHMELEKQKEIKRQKELEKYEAEVRENEIMKKYMELENQKAIEIKKQQPMVKKFIDYENKKSEKAQMIYPEPKNPNYSPKKEEIVNIWECKCGSSNMDDWEICQKCNEIKPGLEGWVCNFCKVRNPDKFSYKCIGCGNSKNSKIVLGQDYWSCKSCNTANSDMVYICEECGEFKDSVMNFRYKFQSKFKPEVEKSDTWKCKNCQTQNFVLQVKCSYCKKAKIEEKNEYNEENVLKNDDWICACKTVNKKYNSLCRNCYTRNEKNVEIQRTVVKEPTRQIEKLRKDEELPKKCSVCYREFILIECPFCKDIFRRADNCRNCKKSMSSVDICSTCNRNSRVRQNMK
ncbi:hypothetical protein SteCoe_24002 [Stentor coeruleus]|uniref:RanBP2-type domain-containing protein n=1 Tax=Stentor coeruleus TaxID=5963 RepID=A0A1R2BII4_9CILI|nr:hypothetical protein SteCoe_24002 [Stentor coeruleus]